MAILVFALIVVVLAALVVWAIDFLPLQGPFNGIAKFIVVIIAVILIANRAGLLSG